jgi:mannobiose 2-epimerase
VLKEFGLNKLDGKWVWCIYEDGSMMTHQDKVGVWKCPYHNSGTCVEIIRHIASLPVEVPAGLEAASGLNYQSAI